MPTLELTTQYGADMPSTERWMTRRDAAELLKVKERTIDAWAREGRLPRYYLAGSKRTPRFRVEDLHALARGENVERVDEP